jgi:hypothetical protein
MENASTFTDLLEKESRALKPDYYLVLPWHFADEFLERERETFSMVLL